MAKHNKARYLHRQMSRLLKIAKEIEASIAYGKFLEEKQRPLKEAFLKTQQAYVKLHKETDDLLAKTVLSETDRKKLKQIKVKAKMELVSYIESNNMRLM